MIPYTESEFECTTTRTCVVLGGPYPGLTYDQILPAGFVRVCSAPTQHVLNCRILIETRYNVRISHSMCKFVIIVYIAQI